VLLCTPAQAPIAKTISVNPLQKSGRRGIAFAKHHWLREATTDTDICFRLRSDEVPCIPNPVIAPHWAEKSSVFVSYYHGYFRSFLT
jgi:hypothetical protein